MSGAYFPEKGLFLARNNRNGLPVLSTESPSKATVSDTGGKLTTAVGGGGRRVFFFFRKIMKDCR